MKINTSKKGTIKSKLIRLIFITLIPLTILKAFDIGDDFNSRINEELKSSREIAEAVSSSFMNYLERIWTTQYALGVSIASNNNCTREDIERYLGDVINNDKEVGEYSWVSTDGKVLASTNPDLVGLNVSEDDCFRQIIAGSEKTISNLQVNKKTNAVYVSIARAIVRDNKLVGIVTSTINENNINNALSVKRIGMTSAFGLIDRVGLTVYHSIYNGLPFEMRRIKPDSPVWSSLSGETVEFRNEGFSIDGSTRMGVSYPIRPIGWACSVSTTVGEKMSTQFKQLIKQIIILILIYIISFIMAILISNHLVKRVKKLEYAAQEVIGGNLSGKTGLKGSDEIAAAGRTFDRMTDMINQKITEVERYNNSKALFLSTMSHELKTPLNIILGYVQLIDKLDLNKPDSFMKSVCKYNKMLRQNSYRLLRLINNLIDINKIEANSISMHPVNGDIVKIVEDITLSVADYTKSKNIELIFDTETEEKVMAFDPDKIERIMLNLLSNAIKFTDTGGVIEVNISDKGGRVLISVRDSGIGIPLDKQQMIFERFTQIDSSLRRKSEGSGIGLSLVKSLVEMHEGIIRLISEPGKGSEFIIELPVRQAEVDCIVVKRVESVNVEHINVEFSDIYL